MHVYKQYFLSANNDDQFNFFLFQMYPILAGYLYSVHDLRHGRFWVLQIEQLQEFDDRSHLQATKGKFLHKTVCFIQQRPEWTWIKDVIFHIDEGKISA